MIEQISYCPGDCKFWRAALTLVLVFGLGWLPASLKAASPSPILSFDTASAAPRTVEPTTAQALQRDYAHAWQRLILALAENRGQLLGEDFVGVAQEHWDAAIAAQKQNGISRHITDHGHHVQVRFYSPDGSSLQAIDTADLEIEYRDGSEVLASQRIQARYLVLLTPAENSWKVRVLEELPSS